MYDIAHLVNNPNQHLSATEIFEFNEAIRALHRTVVVYRALSPADEALRVLNSDNSRRAYRSRLNLVARLFGYYPEVKSILSTLKPEYRSPISSEVSTNGFYSNDFTFF